MSLRLNQIRVVVQKALLANKGAPITQLRMPNYWRLDLRQELRDDSKRYKKSINGDRDVFCGCPIVIDNSLKEPIAVVKQKGAVHIPTLSEYKKTIARATRNADLRHQRARWKMERDRTGRRFFT